MKKGAPISTITQPMPADIRQARLEAGLTQSEAAGTIHVSLRTWQGYESETEGDTRRMLPAFWELFELKALAINSHPDAFRPEGKLVPLENISGWIRTRLAKVKK